MFGDRRTAFITEQQSMTVFPDLKFPTRTGPLTGFRRFGFALREKLARTHRTSYLFNVASESFDEDFCNFLGLGSLRFQSFHGICRQISAFYRASSVLACPFLSTKLRYGLARAGDGSRVGSR
jgi:hypothetical protein